MNLLDTLLNDFGKFVNNKLLSDYQIKLDLTGNFSNEYPLVDIYINHNCVYSGFVEDRENISIQVTPITKRQLLKIIFKNKTDKDTILENNKIIRDKNLIINGIYLDDVSVNLNNSRYQYGIEKVQDQQWLSFNGEWKLYYEVPVYDYIIKNSMKNNVIFQDTTHIMNDILEKLSTDKTNAKV